MGNLQPYNKPWKSLDEQLDIMLSRGLLLDDYPREKAINKLQYIGYYRLSGYAFLFKNNPTTDNFAPNTTFKDLIECYKFDRKLKLLLLDGIEKIEIALRANMAYILSEISPFYINENRFFNLGQYIRKPNPRMKVKPFTVQDSITIIRQNINGFISRSREFEPSISHLLAKYSPPYPLWIEIQVFDFGTLSNLYAILNINEAKKISAEFGVVSPKIFASWIQIIKILRNICAHHARLYGRKFTQTPAPVTNLSAFQWLNLWNGKVVKYDHLFYQICIIHHLLQSCNIKSAWEKNIKDLIKNFPKISSNKFTSIEDILGCGENWEKLDE